MAWDFKIKFTKLLNTLMIFLVLSSQLNSVLCFDCGPINQAKSCECSIGGSWEVICPRYPADEEIQIQVFPMAEPGTVYLKITCKVTDKLPWSTVKGLDLSTLSNSYNITKVSVNYCPASIPENPNVLKEFFNSINLSLETISSFSFISLTSHRTVFPVDLLVHMKNLKTLQLEKLNLAQIPNITNLHSLQELVLRNNEITSISNHTFPSNSQLTSIDLSQNQISKLEPNVLPSSLVLLNLANNTILKINKNTFSNLIHLKYLTLTWNPLTQMESDALSNLKNLVSIRIDSSEFNSFPSFDGLEKLEEINISYKDRSHLTTRSIDNDSTKEPVALSLKRTVAPSTSILQTEIPITTTTEDSSSPLSTESNKEFFGQIRDMPYLSRLNLLKDGLTGFPYLYNLPNLTVINLHGNNIQTLPKDALKELTSLEILDLSNNQISVLNDLQAPNLKTLNLNNNQLTSLSETVFTSLINLEKLFINNNKISSIHQRSFSKQFRLRFMDLSHNQIEFEVPDVNRLVIHNEDPLFGFSGLFDEQSPLRFCSKLKKLDLSHNGIQIIHNDWKAIFAELEILNLSYNNFTGLHATDLTFLAENLKLDLSNNKITEVMMQNAQLFLDGKTITVDIDQNPLNCDCNIYAFKTFNVEGVSFKYSNKLKCQEPSWLRGVEFKNVIPTDLQCPADSSEGCPTQCNCWKIPANYTISVDCSNRNLTQAQIPSLDAFEMCNFGNSRCNITFNLSGNKITELNSTHEKHFSSAKLQKVDLSHNELHSISFMPLLPNNETLFYLSENKFSCRDCDFHKTLRNQFKRVPDYINVSCVFEEEAYEDGSKRLVRYFVDEFPEDQICIQNTLATEVQALIITFSIILFLLVIFIGVYIRYGWAIRAFLYSKGLGCCFMVDDEDDSEKVYDAFVSYSHKDEDWVLSQLVPRLEDQEGFKLCLHFRDWTPGDWIPDQIVRSVDQSRRTVIILSKHFVQSIWSTLEFKASHTQAITEKTNRLILVLMDDELKEEDIQDDDLRVYMKMNTYLKYNDPWFWHKLKYALPHTKSQSVEENFKKQQQRDRAIQLDKLRTKLESSLA